MSIFNKLKKYSFKEIIKIVLAKFFFINIVKLHYLKLDIKCSHILKKYEVNDIEIKELVYGDFLLGDKKTFDKKKLNLLSERCKDDTYKAYGLIKNKKLIYSTWISLEKLGLPVDTNLKLNANEGLLEDSYTHPSERGKGLHRRMNYYRLKKLHELGKSKCIAIVLSGNQPAFKVQLQTGFKELGTFYAGTLFGLSFTTLNKKKYDNK